MRRFDLLWRDDQVYISQCDRAGWNLERIEQHAASLSLESLKLETGPPPHFAAANKFYEKHGFKRCGLFGEYKENRHSVFYEKAL